MTKDASLFTRIAYCLVVLGAILPFGLARSAWVALGTGPGFAASVPYFGPVLLLVIGLYRVCVVARAPGALGSPPASDFIHFLRAAGLVLLFVGAVSTVLGWVARPLMHAFMQSHTESGAEFFLVGYILAMASRVGFFGLLLFELGRLRGFEQKATGA
jgi:hypothetical protein